MVNAIRDFSRFKLPKIKRPFSTRIHDIKSLKD